MAARAISPVVLMIGSNGSGKSTLGNFLLNPGEEHIFSKQTFRTSRANVPETRHVKCAMDNRDNPTIQVVDTPGLNEGDYEDLDHMAEVVRTLRGLHYVSACVLCVRFTANIDAQWKATVAYYKSLLPKLFETNVIIVMTDFQRDSKSVRLREMQGIDVDKVTSNVVGAVKRCAGLTYSPPVFRIDSLPLDESDRPQSEMDREAILSFIQQSLKPISVGKLTLAKTNALKRQDREEIIRLEGEIRSHTERLKQMKKDAKPLLDAIESVVMNLSEVEQKLAPLKEELADKDSPDHVIAETWSLKEKWKLFRWQSQRFECESKWHIADHDKFDNGHLKWKELTIDDRLAYGKVEGEFMRGLYATLILKTEKRSQYAERISELRETIDAHENSVAAQKSKLEEIQIKLRMEEKDQLFDDLMDDIEKKRKQIREISQNYLTLEEVERRLEELQPSVD